MVPKMKKALFLLALATLFLPGCQATTISQKMVIPYETPKYYGPIYPLTEAVTLRYGEHPESTVSGSIEDESYINGKHEKRQDLIHSNITTRNFGPDLEWIATKIVNQVTINKKKNVYDFSETHIKTVMSKRGEYKTSDIKISSRMIVNTREITLDNEEKKEIEKLVRSIIMFDLALPERPIAVGDDFRGSYKSLDSDSANFELKFVLTGVTYYQGRKSYHFNVVVVLEGSPNDGILERNAEGFALFDSARGAITYLEMAGYVRWNDSGQQNWRKIITTRKLDTHNW